MIHMKCYALQGSIMGVRIRQKIPSQGCQVMPDCDCEGWIFLSTPHTHNRFFFWHTPFTSECRYFNNAVTWIANVRDIVIILLWRL